MKGSQVFTKAPRLSEENSGKAPLVGVPPRAPSVQTQKGLLPLGKCLEPLPHPQTWSTNGLGQAWRPL